MDKITGGLLTEFSKDFGIDDLPESDRFEQLATYVTVRRHYSETAFHPNDLVTGGGGDGGIDAIAIIVNNNLVTDVDAVEDLLDLNKYLEATFIFIQAERSPNFDMAKIGQFGFGLRDLFGDRKLHMRDEVAAAAEIIDAIYAKSGKFTRGNPTCYMYYVTTGVWKNEHNLVVRFTEEVDALKATGLFSKVEFYAVGADQLQKLFNQSINATTKEFLFPQRCTVAYDIANVREAHLGYMSATTYLSLVCDDDGALIESLFYENVRDWLGYEEINREIRDTLQSDSRDRFLLMNNGITIIARGLSNTAHKYTMSGYQIVNGCQTSHVLADNRPLLTDDVNIPVRIICTQDEAVMESIITATNRQTEVKPDQFFALKPFAKKLEAYFKTFAPNELYYERRAHQYDNQAVSKKRIIVHQNLVRAVGAMFLSEPHRTTKTYRLLSAKVGKDIFVDGDRLEPYYVAAYSLFRLEALYQSKRLAPAQFKPARYQILLAARLIVDKAPLSPMNSHAMAKRCEAMMDRLWTDADAILAKAASVIDQIAEGRIERDSIRTERVTSKILEYFGKAED